jgi:2-dehydro-3-deoxyphosphogluconate aldolase/(4S)-4-hydroxy-2-oxoglutarate aldolase
MDGLIRFSAKEVMQDSPVIPVIVIDQEEDAVPLAKALVAGGIRMLEVTLRTAVALRAIKAIAQEVPQAVVGAGTVRNAEQALFAFNAGARFAVSPGFSLSVAKACQDLGLTWLPGVSTATEVMQAQEHGFNELKFFPAVPAGGVKMLQALQGPFSEVSFCPTGGISAANAHEFLSLSNVLCVGGSWLVPGEALRQRNWDAITQLAAQAKTLNSSRN